MDVNEKLSLQIKLKPNQRLSCASCALFFEDILSAAEHIVSCKVMPLTSNKKSNQWAEYSKRRADNNSGKHPKRPCNVSPLISSQWTQKTVAILLKAISKWSKILGDIQQDQLKIWNDISAELEDKYPWALQSVCQIKWRKLCEDVNTYDMDAMNHTIPKPPFYYVVRDIQKRIKANNERSKKARVFTDVSSLMLNSVKVEGVEEPPDDDLADPDAFEEEPFGGVLDSRGNTIMREVLLEIVQSIESFDCTPSQMAEKHQVEEAIIEWVKTNQDAVTRGSLRCPTCDRRILKRKDYVEHTLDCAQLTSKEYFCNSPAPLPPAIKDNEKNPWPNSVTAKLIKIFTKTCRAYLSPQGSLRAGIWLEVYRGLKKEINGLTPKIIFSKWRKLVLAAKEYTFKTEATSITKEPPFYKAISHIIDLSRDMSEDKDFLNLKQDFLNRKTSFNDDLLEFNYEDSFTPTSDGNGKLIPYRSFLPQNMHSNLKEEISDLDEDEELEDEQTESDEEDPALPFDSSDDDLNEDYELPDSIEPSIHLIATPKDESTSFDKDRGDNNPSALKGMESKADVILSRLSQLEEETQTMKYILDSKESTYGNVEESLGNLQQKFSKGHAETVECFTNMSLMMERHHRENIEALNNLTNAILQSREKT